MNNDVYYRKSYSLIRFAQYLSNLTAEQDVRDEACRAVIRLLNADAAAFAGTEDGEKLKVYPFCFSEEGEWSCTWKDVFTDAGGRGREGNEPARIVTEAVEETLESGFLSIKSFTFPDTLSIAFLPVSEGNRTDAVLLIGHKTSELFPKEVLDIYLAVAGLVGTTARRINSEKELQEHRSNLEKLVKERTEELRQEYLHRKQTEKKLLNIFDTMEDRIYIINPNYEVEYMNPAFKKDFGSVKKEKCYSYLNQYQEVCPWCRSREVFAGTTERWEWHCPINGKTYDTISTSLKNADGTTSMLNIFRDITERKRNEDKIKLLLREVHHRIKNNMATVKGILSLQAENVPDDSAKEVLLNADERLTSMMLLYDKLYRSNISETVSIKDYLNVLLDEIISTYQKNVHVAVEVENATIPVSIAAPLGIIVNELVSNAMKYAFEGTGDHVLEVAVARAGGRLNLTVQDNGKGFDVKKNPYGFGMELVNLLADQIGGTFTIERNNGTRCVLEFELRKEPLSRAD